MEGFEAMAPPKRYSKSKYVKLAGSAVVAHRAPTSNVGVKNIDSARCDGFTQEIVVKITIVNLAPNC